MRLGVDAREIQDGVYTGIGRALMHFLNYFREGSHRDECVLFSEKSLPGTWGGRFRTRVMAPSCRLWWDQVLLPAAIRRERVELFFSPYYKIPLSASCRKVSSVLDLTYLRYPSYAHEMTLAQTLYYKITGRQFVKQSDMILTCSEHSRKDIVAIYGAEPSRIKVIPLGVSRGYCPVEEPRLLEEFRQALGITGRYLLYVGNFRPHKNVPVLIEAFSYLKKEFPDLVLVLVAPKTHGYESLAARARTTGVSGDVIFTGVIRDEAKLRLLYAGAEAFLFPSLYEGFGIPPAEAMACGTPVVCANATCLPETVAGAGMLVAPQDPSAYAGAIRRLLNDPVYRRELRSRGLRRVESIREDYYGRQVHDLLGSLSRGA